VKAQQTEKTVRAKVKCKVCELAIALWLLVIPNIKSAINPITNPNPVYSRTVLRDIISDTNYRIGRGCRKNKVVAENL
jgi:hypothetical protein